MCGIAGILTANEGSPDPSDLAPALAAMAKRGPDGQGLHVGPGIALASCRLAVIDPDAPPGPFSSADGERILAMNGEIHDYVEHRRRFRARGTAFRTGTDTEVLAELLAEGEEKTFRRVTGMFATAVWRPASRTLTLGRDAFGIKPLLYAEDRSRGVLRFASTLPALLAGRGRPRLDVPALVERLAFQVPLSNRTLVEGIESVPPGCLLEAGSDNGRRIRRWREPDPVPEEGRAEEDWVAELSEAVEKAVRRSLRSDAALGLTFSGGLDSSIVAALASRHAKGRLAAFTGYYDEGPEFDERFHAEGVAAELPLSLDEVEIRPGDLLRRLDELAEILEGPVAGPGSLGQIVVADRAAERVRVLLTGQGADEVFSGYARTRLAWLAFTGRLDPDRLPPELAGYRPLARRLAAIGGGEGIADLTFELVYRGGGLSDLLGPAVRAEYEAYDARGAFGDVFEDAAEHPLARMAAYERRTLLPALLHVEDRVSMSRSLESRVPFLDRELVRLAARIPAPIAFGDGEGKRILRAAARGFAPSVAVGRRDKMGFPVPLAKWAAGPTGEALLERLRDGPLVREGILAPGAPERLVAGAGGHGRHLWFFLLLSAWMEATGATL